MSPRIVVVPPTFAEIAEIARKVAPSGFELVVARNDRAELEPALATAEYMVCYPNVTTNDAFYRAAPRLKLIQLLSAGYDDVDIEAARRAKVPVCNNGGANAISVSEHAMMLMLTVSRRVIWQQATSRAAAGAATARRRACTRFSTRRSASSGSAPSARRWRGSRARSACGCSITTSRGCPSTRRTRSACASACSASCCAPPTS